MAQHTLTYRELEARWKALRRSGARVREVACVGAPRTLLCAEFGESDSPAVHVSAGVHGDEPAGVLALLALAEAGAFDTRYSLRLWPCTNPTGFDAATRANGDGIDVNRTFGRGGSSPESKAIVMANRDRKFVLALDLHEDDEAVWPYAYEYGPAGIGEALVGERLMRPNPQEEAELLGGLSLSLLLCRNAATRVLTLESAAGAPLEERIDFHVRAVRRAIQLLPAAP
jgi:murein peptide amidase A